MLTYKSYQFTRGLPGEKESSWTAMQRLAGEVKWRCFALAGVITFATDYELISRRARVVLDGPLAEGLLDRPSYDWDHGKIAGEVELRLIADLYSIPPGSVFSLQHMGPVSGRWLVHTVEQNLFDKTDTTVTLVKAMAPGKEPAPVVSTKQVDADGNALSGTGAETGHGGSKEALAWARSKLGHYKEEFGSNRGSELDRLEQQFGMTGAPWCAIFATTAVTQGGVTRECRTASCADLQAWGAAGTHGYQKGYRTSPEPGDLMVQGTQHVILVETVDRAKKTLTAIQGNGSAGKVDRRSMVWPSPGWTFVRPKYPD